jgi:hypothetical protein
VFVGSFQSHGAAIGVGDVRGGRALALADITALRVRLVEVIDGIVGTGISFRGDDRWSLAGVRLRVPATASPRLPGVLGWPQGWRVLTSFFNVGTTLDKRDPVFTSPVIA